jgi:hypothetical protein
MGKRNRKRKKKRKKKKKMRNWIAVHAHFKTGAGNHGDQKKAENKAACRGPQNPDACRV